MRRYIIWSLVVSIAFLCSATNLAARSDSVDGGSYTTKDSEFYLTPEQLLFIRPGLVMDITNVVIPADRKAEVTFTLTDPAGLPLDMKRYLYTGTRQRFVHHCKYSGRRRSVLFLYQAHSDQPDHR